MRVALDTNILANVERVDDDQRYDRAASIIKDIGVANIVVPAQALAELSHVLLRKAKKSRAEISVAIGTWLDAYAVADTTATALRDATMLSAVHDLQIFDAIMLAVAAESGCVILLSEDMHNGFAWRGCTVATPFADALHPLLALACNRSRSTP